MTGAGRGIGCAQDATGQSFVSLDLTKERGLDVTGFDGKEQAGGTGHR
ncbi:hypothetical protein AB0395_08520 [Streptosporangium sp. NPDC051023]